MDSIRSKKEIKLILSKLSDESLWISVIESELLKKKIKFPLLEFVGKELYFKIPDHKQIYFTDQIIELGHMGGYVISAIILQLRSEKYFEQSLNKAVEYILLGNEWYVCDIIGERVMGHFLLKEPEKTHNLTHKLNRILESKLNSAKRFPETQRLASTVARQGRV
ncbi:hypothetical protein LEP1GSC008_1270 [Leptospira kirschneri serovar Bulgarica str. Nikolaevo]|uniref:Uncharacterized protein n=1 Tax=Leptospira kirschneri serovar Bulgarica str. Nikolaevo TaxID=1240687 RepID=M6F615_9LEPT|nr:hypothetical protein LEP1GSC008_1270 [Leptospira kirschneri serovar Bulgarica str. Nikolaevo]